MLTTNEILDKVNQALVHFSFDREPAGLYDPVRYVLSLGGKRIRPVLMLMAYSLYKKDIDACMPAALGLEIYHNFTLLHDEASLACIKSGTTTPPSFRVIPCWCWPSR